MAYSSSRKTFKRPTTTKCTTSCMNIFLSTFMSLVLILLLIYLGLVLVLTWQYYSSKLKLQKYALSNIEIMSKDLDAKYDFVTDNLAIKHTNSKLARDLTDALVAYYDNNLQTVQAVANSIIQSASPVQLSVSTLSGYDLLAFKSHAQAFVVSISKHIKPVVLEQTNYFPRFFSMVVQTLPLESTEAIVGEIKDFLAELLSTQL